MDAEVAKYLLMVAGGLIVLLLGIIGYFLSKHISVTEELTRSVNALNVTVGMVQNNQSNFSTNCSATHKTIDMRLNAHSAKISEHETAITELMVTQNITLKRKQQNP